MTKKLVVGTDQKPTPEQLLEMFEKLDTQTKEIKGQMKRGALNSRHIQALIEHRNSFPDKEGMTLPLKHDFSRDGYVLLENKLFDGRGFVPEVLDVLVPGLLYITGDTMQNRAKRLNANLGQYYAEWLMDHQNLLSKELRGEYRLAFPGTVWKDSNGELYVPCLTWNWKGASWEMSLSNLNREWTSKDCMVRALW